MELQEILKKYFELRDRFESEIQQYLEAIVAELKKVVYGLAQLIEEDPSLQKNLPIAELNELGQFFEAMEAKLESSSQPPELIAQRSAALKKFVELIAQMNKRFPDLEDKSKQYAETMKKSEQEFIEMMKKMGFQSPLPDDQLPKDVLDLALDDMEGKDTGMPGGVPVPDLDDLWGDEFGDDTEDKKPDDDEDEPEDKPEDDDPDENEPDDEDSPDEDDLEDDDPDEDDPEDKPEDEEFPEDDEDDSEDKPDKPKK